MKKENWVWMPHPAHFICSYDCRFFLSTYIGSFIVSTVGELWPERSSREIHAKVHNPKWLAENRHLLGDTFDVAYMKKFGYQDIGCDRKYETMVFKAVKMPKGRCSACLYTISSGDEVDFLGYNDAASAYKGHLKLCKKWSKK